MNDASMTIALVSTVISSVALVGVAFGLILQARQLQASRIQALRVSHAELVRMAVDYPVLSDDVRWPDADARRKAVLLNWQFEHFELCFVSGQLSEDALRWHCSRYFVAPFPLVWWSEAREIWDKESVRRRERRFFEVVDREYHRAAAQSVTADQENRSGAAYYRHVASVMGRRFANGLGGFLGQA